MTTLNDLRAAIQEATQLRSIADRLERDAVSRCRDHDHTWADIGLALNISKQAAQARFGTNERKDDAMADDTTQTSQLLALVQGPAQPLGDLPRATGGAAGVFTIWCNNSLVYLGYARTSAAEAKTSNSKQADGARGRLAGVRRQPPLRLCRTLTRTLTGIDVVIDEKAARALLEQTGEYRLVETASGHDAAQLHAAALVWLPENGYEVPEG